MRKLIQTLVTVVIGLGMVAGVANATSQSCTISDTAGNNQCSFTSGQTCKVTNNTLVSIGNTNVQDATSGQAVVTQNTNGGTATSGNANNNNSNNTVVGVTNGSACVVTVTEVPAVGGAGAAPAAATPAPQAAAPVGGVNAGSTNIATQIATVSILAGSVLSGTAAFYRIRKAARTNA